MRRLATLAMPAVALLAAPAMAGAHPGFLAAPTDQLAVPGSVAGAEVTPEGDVYTGWAEVRFEFGRALRRWEVPTRHLTAGRYPVLRSSARDGRVAYAMTALIDLVDGEPVVFVRVEVRNRGPRRAVARWRAIAGASFGDAFRFPRPAVPSAPGLYTQPGAPFDPARTYVHGDRDARFALAAGQARAIDLRIPVDPATPADDGASFAYHRAAALARWRAALRGAVRLELPEPGVRDAFYASLVHMLEPRYRLPDGRWVQAVNKLQYHSFWLRDAAVIAQALDLAGLHEPAAQDLAFFSAWQRPDGLFISRAGQLDGFGQALWALGEHARLTGDAAFARAWLPAVERAIGWLERARAADPLGLVPPSDPGDNELVAGHLAGDDFWAVAGVSAAARLARVAGAAAPAARWQAAADDLRRLTRARVREAAARAGQTIPPALDARGGRDWGNLWAAWPEPVLAPTDPLVTRTMRHARARFAEGIATYGASLHGYLGFRVWQTELAAGSRLAVVDGLYAALAHLTATQGCFELGTRPWGRRLISQDLAPHAWCAAEIVALLRNMLVRERDGGVQLLAAVSPAWLGGGRRIALRGAPATGGTVDVAMTSTARGARLTWRAPPGTRVWWTVPASARSVRAGGRAIGSRLVALPASRGTLAVRWRLVADRRSLARTRARLAAGYRRHGRTPPF